MTPLRASDLQTEGAVRPIFVGVVACLIVLGQALRGSFTSVTDPDTLVRLTRLREDIQTGWLVDGVRDGNLGFGLSLHWSHLLECIMLPFVLLLRPLIGLDHALLTVGSAVGPLTVALLAATLAWAISPLVHSDRRLSLAIGLFTASAPPLAGYGALGVGGHHVLLVAAAALTAGTAFRVARNPGTSRAVLLGLSAALGCWISIESLPYCLLAFIGLALAWLTEPTLDRRLTLARNLALASLTTTLGVSGAILIDPPGSGLLGTEIDRISLPYACLGLVGLLPTLAMIGLSRRPDLASRLALPIAIAAGGAAIWLLSFTGTAALLGTFITPSHDTFRWEMTAELRPVSGLSEFALMCGFGTLGLILGASVLRSKLSPILLTWLVLGGIACIAQGAHHLRFSPYAAAVGVVGMTLFLDWLYRTPAIAPALGRLAGAALMLVAVAAPIIPTVLGSSDDAAAPPKIALTSASSYSNPCLAPAWPLVGGQVGSIVLAHLNDSPDILFRVPGVRIVAAAYHRGVEGLAAYMQTWHAAPNDARTAMARLHIHWVVACPITPPAPDAASSSENLHQLLENGGLPDWLKPASSYTGSRKPMLFEVTDTVPSLP